MSRIIICPRCGEHQPIELTRGPCGQTIVMCRKCGYIFATKDLEEKRQTPI